MRISLSSLGWLGNFTFACLLLTSSLPTFTSTQDQTAAGKNVLIPAVVASTDLAIGRNSNLLHKQQPKKSNPIKTAEADELNEKKMIIQAHLAAAEAQNLNNSQPPENHPKQAQIAMASQIRVSRSNSSDLVDHALSLQGIPYVFGGTSRKGFDCSGYTQYVFNGSGIDLPRTASEQFTVGSPINREQLQAGDLVFFSTYAHGASHVGIYIGDGRFISASNRGVSISSLTGGYYESRYLGARRVK